METTINWLKKYCPVSLGPDEIERLFTMSGSEVEERVELDATGDVALKLEITSNRTDCYGTLGLARELSALTGTRFALPPAKYSTLAEKTEDVTSVTVECPDLCPVYTAQVIRNVKVGPSPSWLLELFETLAAPLPNGKPLKNIRPVNNVVDITNFVLLETAQPLHAFDLDKMAGRRAVIRRAKKGERMRAINDVEYVFDVPPPLDRREPGINYENWYWDDDICVIGDAHNPQCLGGVMGGKDTEITADTTTILLESAYFAPINNRKTSFGLGLVSDSSYRFSRGVDPAGIVAASRRCAQLIADLCGGEVYDGIIQVGSLDPFGATIPFRQEAIARTLGIDVPQERVVQIFTGLGLDVEKTDKKPVESFNVKIPSFRRDLTREIDLVEEVGRVVGFDQIPTDTTLRATSAAPKKVERLTRRLREFLVGAGFYETVSDSFVKETGVWQLTPWPSGGPCIVTNPVVTGQGLLRPAISQSLLWLRKTNQDRGTLNGVRLFEICRVYAHHLEAASTSKNKAKAKTKNGANKGSASASGSGKVPADAVTPALERRVLGLTADGPDAFLDLKGVIDAIGRDWQIEWRYAPADFALLETGQATEILVATGTTGPQRIGVVGQVAQSVLDGFELQAPCAVAELDLDALELLARFDKRFVELPRFPGMVRELAVVLPEPTMWQDLESTVRQSAGPLLVGVDYLDEYRGKQIPKGRKQYNFAMHFQHDGRSLTSEEINAVMQHVLDAIATAHNGELRR